jgi:hypothetical protein
VGMHDESIFGKSHTQRAILVAVPWSWGHNLTVRDLATKRAGNLLQAHHVEPLMSSEVIL